MLQLHHFISIDQRINGQLYGRALYCWPVIVMYTFSHCQGLLSHQVGLTVMGGQLLMDPVIVYQTKVTIVQTYYPVLVCITGEMESRFSDYENH